MIRAIISALTSRLAQPRVIFDRSGASPYLSRWYLLGGPRESAGAFNAEGNPVPGVAWKSRPFDVFLHRFHRGDDDTALHNHPWEWSIAVILAGGYIEERRAGTTDGIGRGSRIRRRIFAPGSVNVIRANDFHRVDLLEEDSWSLFIAGPRTQSWGFWDRDTGEFVPWREFITRLRGAGWAES